MPTSPVATTSAPTLPVTGTSTITMGGTGAALLLAGTFMLVMGQRRRPVPLHAPGRHKEQLSNAIAASRHAPPGCGGSRVPYV
ncbi:MAG: hypothetical protein ACRDTM_04435 [Micromonosporaceae bacterium]